jgi:hypothetical protein
MNNVLTIQQEQIQNDLSKIFGRIIEQYGNIILGENGQIPLTAHNLLIHARHILPHQALQLAQHLPHATKIPLKDPFPPLKPHDPNKDPKHPLLKILLYHIKL